MTEKKLKQKKNMSDQSDTPDNFEVALEKLKLITEKLSNSDLSLEDALENYRQGIAYVKTCQEALNKSEKTIKILQKKSDKLEEYEFNEDN